MKDEDFKAALADKKIPILVLDQKWHRLFAVHGKTDEIKSKETELNELLARQGKLNTDIKEYKKLKNKLMGSIVENIDETEDHEKAKKREEDKRLIDEVNQKIEDAEEELLDIPHSIKKVNGELMILSMDYFYEKLRVNQHEANEIDEWIKQIRIDLKKNIIKKQNREINNREIYAYLHDIFGSQILDIFDIQYEEKEEESEENKSSEAQPEEKKSENVHGEEKER